MHITREKFLFLLSGALFLAVLLILILRKLFSFIPLRKILVVDYENKFSYRPFKITSYDKFMYIEFFKNPLTYFLLKKIIKKSSVIHTTKEFKKSSLFEIFEKYYKIPASSFEDCVFKNLETILKSLNTDIKSICICFKKSRGDYEKLKKVTDVCTHFTDKIFLSTDEIIIFDKLNSTLLEKTGVGLLYKNIETVNDCDVIIILNEKLCDFSKKARFVINLQNNHFVYGCNLLYDFYDKSCFPFEHINIKKAFFCDVNAVFLKLQWKIMKKS